MQSGVLRIIIFGPRGMPVIIKPYYYIMTERRGQSIRNQVCLRVQPGASGQYGPVTVPVIRLQLRQIPLFIARQTTSHGGTTTAEKSLITPVVTSASAL